MSAYHPLEAPLTEREPTSCRVYWASHGCGLGHGHPGRKHVCTRADPDDEFCGSTLRWWLEPYGEDARRWSRPERWARNAAAAIVFWRSRRQWRRRVRATRLEQSDREYEQMWVAFLAKARQQISDDNRR